MCSNLEQLVNSGNRLTVVLYAPEDWLHAQELLAHLLDVQALEISGTALATLTVQPIRCVLLLMSIDLLHRLVCERKYRSLYRRLKIFEREKMTVIVYLRACHWQDSFEDCSLVFPSGEAITARQGGSQKLIYEEIATQLREI